MKFHRLILLLFVLVSSAKAAAPLYQEPWRPQFHFTPERNWMNDPNGLVFYEGEYHLFYQHNPEGNKWGHMSWGHAVSKDLVHWEHLPIALREENNVMIFSGSAVVDWKNTSGFGVDGQPPLVAIYTGHHTDKPRQDQRIAYSNDRGRTWTKYSGDPVLDIGEADFRDPKVFWHEPTKRWIMAVTWCNHHQVRLYGSPNLKDWTHLSDFGPAGATGSWWECPDLFPVSIEGRGNRQKWVMIVNGGGLPNGGPGCQYFVGDFDGTTFTLDPTYPKPQPEHVPGGIVLGDFEGGSYGEWKATGDAFGSAPANGTLANQQSVAGFRGQGLVNTYRNGDASTGTLTSPEFEVSKDHLSFLIGGGRHPGDCALNLLVDGAIARTATGDDNERLAWKSWDVRELRGKKAKLQIVDRRTGGWGHINVDHILLADTPARPATQPALWTDYGVDFYAAVTYGDIPVSDGRRIFMGWMNGPHYAGSVPTDPWRSAQSVPRELSLRRTGAGLRLIQKPVRELAKLRTELNQLKNASLTEATRWLASLPGLTDTVEIELEWSGLTTDGETTLEWITGPGESTAFRYDARSREFAIDRTRSGRSDFHGSFAAVHRAPVDIRDGRLKIHLLVDRSLLELFANDGEAVFADQVFPAPGKGRWELRSTAKQPPKVEHLSIAPLKSIWPKP
jgi:sucrose-6-phosphate hydrolase SacC (GH32 family)